MVHCHPIQANMKEQNRLKLQRLSERYDRRAKQRQCVGEADIRRDFISLCDGLLQRLMEEVASELRKAGHTPRIIRMRAPDEPTIELDLGLWGDQQYRNVVGFTLIHWTDEPLQILAYLEARRPPPFDLERFSRASDVGSELVEQLLVNAVEHIISCNAP